MATENLTNAEYIAHHLVNLNQTFEEQTEFVDFSLINLDTIFWSVLAGIVCVLFLYC